VKSEWWAIVYSQFFAYLKQMAKWQNLKIVLNNITFVHWSKNWEYKFKLLLAQQQLKLTNSIQNINKYKFKNSRASCPKNTSAAEGTYSVAISKHGGIMIKFTKLISMTLQVGQDDPYTIPSSFSMRGTYTPRLMILAHFLLNIFIIGIMLKCGWTDEQTDRHMMRIPVSQRSLAEG
jgi:hypothetical protein